MKNMLHVLWILFFKASRNIQGNHPGTFELLKIRVRVLSKSQWMGGGGGEGVKSILRHFNIRYACSLNITVFMNINLFANSEGNGNLGYNHNRKE